MRVTAIKQQLKRANRYSVFVDGKYCFSLSESALLEAKLASGQELGAEQVRELKKLSADDKLYHRVLRYTALRPRSAWEVEFYMKRHDASPALSDIILNKLSNVGLIDDEKLAQAIIHDARLLRPSSRRKLHVKLRQKRIDEQVIQKSLGAEPESDLVALRSVVERKRRQTKYQDQLKLMQYLARQGFNYDDIKTVLNEVR